MEFINDDCLDHIFSFLPMIDRIKAEEVCKRWQCLAQISWRHFPKLDLSKDTWGRWIFGPDQAVTIHNDHILQNVLQKYGCYFKSIELTYYHSPNNNNFYNGEYLSINCIKHCINLEKVILRASFKIILAHIMNMINHCNNILELNLTNLQIRKNELNDFSDLETKLINLCSKNKKLKVINLFRINVSDNFLKNCLTDSINTLALQEASVPIEIINLENYNFNFKNLKTLILCLGCSEKNKSLMNAISINGYNITELDLNLNKMSYEKELEQLFSISKLEKLSLRNSNITGSCLLNLKEDYIKSIVLQDCDCIEIFYLVCILKKLKKLTTINMCFSGTLSLTNQYLEVISKHSGLEHLQLECLSKSMVTFNCLNLILLLNNLKTLSLSKNSCVTDDFLLAVSKNLLNLSNLEIVFCKNVTDEGMKHLSKLPNLKHLYVAGLKITGEGFGIMPYLITLKCNFCFNIKYEYLLKIIENFLDLQYFNICSCFGLEKTNKFLKLAYEAFSKSSNNKKILTILTDVGDIFTEKVNPNLKFIVLDKEPYYWLFTPKDYLKLPEYQFT